MSSLNSRTSFSSTLNNHTQFVVLRATVFANHAYTHLSPFWISSLNGLKASSFLARQAHLSPWRKYRCCPFQGSLMQQRVYWIQFWQEIGPHCLSLMKDWTLESPNFSHLQ